MYGEKLQKVLARAGVGSRREIERMISDGKITVNSKRATLGIRVSAEDNININGRVFKKHKKHRPQTELILYHKPVGEVSTRRDPQRRKTVFSKLPKPMSGRWISVGRLDINTSGLLIFTNNGDLANKLMHPSSQLDREYAVRIFGKATEEQLDKLRSGVDLDGYSAKFEHIVEAGGKGRNNWYHVVIREGKNREVRRMWESVELPVSRLIRVRYGPFELYKLPPGKTLSLHKDDLKFLDEYMHKCKNTNAV